MKRLLILLSILAICYNTTFNDCTGFNTAIESGCSALGSGTNVCIWSNSKCIQSYTNCEDYNPASGFDDATCKLISPPDRLYKCVVKISGSTKTCDQELKECADYDSKDNNCINLKAGENQRCVLLNDGKCQSHYDDCSQVTGQNSCYSNIPKDTSKKCVWNGSCGETDRLCEDYITYNDKYINNEHSQTLKSCLELKAETNKICIYEDSKECKQYYEKCEIANENEALCSKIKPLNADKTGFDHLNKCVYSTTYSTCTKQLKECKDYIKGEDDGAICVRLKSSDEDNKFCYYDTLRDECPEIYITCENYDLVVTDSAQRTAPECESITPRDTSTKTEDFYSICDLDEVDSNSCKTIKRPCNKIQTKNICNSQTLDDGNKRCLYTGTTCKEIYKTCELYDTSVTTNKNKEDCEIIEPKYDGDTSIYKCIFDTTLGCSKKKLTCEDYTGRDEDYCKSLTVNLDASHKCAMIGGKCIEQFKDCTSYTEKNKTICESIVLYDQPNYKCILHQDKECKPEQKLCSEYLGKIASECLGCKASVDTKICAFENNKCVENSIYNYCSDYRGTNKEECESIKPYYIDTGVGVDPSSKCVYTNEGCVRKTKECGDATSETECSTIIPTDGNKQCIYINNKCIEQYKGCELYQNNEDTISDTICESIIINDGTNSPSTHRCVYGAPATPGAKGTCTTQARTCIDFKPELIKSQCTSIELNDETKKCVYDSTNIICSANYKSCLELSTLSNADDNKCKNALTSTNKSCVAKKDRSGCEEIEKQTESQPTNKASNSQDQKQETTPNEEKNNNFGGNKNLSKFIFIAIYLLF